MNRLARQWLPLLVHLGALTPLLLLIIDWWTRNLTANPIQAATQRTGYPALVLLTLSLACTPVGLLTGWKAVNRQRRALGLYGFLYAVIHLVIFMVIDYGLDVALIWPAIIEKRFVLAGLAALSLLVPLAATSTNWSIRWLGRNWKRLHRLVYVAAPLAVLHYLWSVKADYRQPLLFATIILILLALRLPPVRRYLSGRQAARQRQPTVRHSGPHRARALTTITERPAPDPARAVGTAPEPASPAAGPVSPTVE